MISVPAKSDARMLLITEGIVVRGLAVALVTALKLLWKWR